MTSSFIVDRYLCSNLSLIPVCGLVDLAFLVDSSATVGRKNWPKMLDFMKILSSKLTVSPDHARIAVVSFSTEATLHVKLDSHVTLKSTEAAIDEIRWQGQWTNTAAALRVMKNEVFKVCNVLECYRESYILITII